MTTNNDALIQRLRDAPELLRRKAIPLSDFIPLIQQAADALAASNPEQTPLSKFVHASDAEREVLGNVVAAKVDETMKLDPQAQAGEPSNITTTAPAHIYLVVGEPEEDAALLAADKAPIDEAELWRAFDSDPKAALAMAIRGLNRLAADKAGGEVVYQYKRGDGAWIDQTKVSYDYNVKYGVAEVRFLYTHPQPSALPDDVVKDALLNVLKHVKLILEAANSDPQGPICDTIWASPYETLFDYIDAAIAAAMLKEKK